jgi:hypothetical protein
MASRREQARDLGILVANSVFSSNVPKSQLHDTVMREAEKEAFMTSLDDQLSEVRGAAKERLTELLKIRLPG